MIKGYDSAGTITSFLDQFVAKDVFRRLARFRATARKLIDNLIRSRAELAQDNNLVVHGERENHDWLYAPHRVENEEIIFASIGESEFLFKYVPPPFLPDFRYYRSRYRYLHTNLLVPNSAITQRKLLRSYCGDYSISYENYQMFAKLLRLMTWYPLISSVIPS